MKGKGILSGIVLMLSVLAIGSVGVAQATIVTNTFIGTINDAAEFGIVNGGIDLYGDFGAVGGNLVSQPFALTFTYDSTTPDSGPGSATLTINGQSQTLTAPNVSASGSPEVLFQIVQDAAPVREIDVDLLFTSPQDLTKVLPSMVSPADFSVAGLFSWFSDNPPAPLAQELLGFTITAVNPPAVPIPPSALLLGTGLLGMVGLGWRKRKLSQA